MEATPGSFLMGIYRPTEFQRSLINFTKTGGRAGRNESAALPGNYGA